MKVRKNSLVDDTEDGVMPGAKDDGTREARLGQVLEAYLAAVEAGEPADHERLIAAHPEIADELRACLRSLSFLGDADAALEASGTVDGGAPGRDPVSEDPASSRIGDYRILREVGRGGMGIVYEAEQVSLGRRVALKVLPFAAVLDQKQIQRFKNEAHAAAQLHHNNIVPVFGVGSDRGVHYYAMQLIEGQSLAEAIKELRHLEGLDGKPAQGEAKEQGAARKGSADDARANDAGANDATHAISSLSRVLASGSFAPLPKSHRDERVDSGTAPSDATSTSTGTTQASLGGPSTGRKTRSTRTTAYLRSIASLGRQAAEALEHAHDMGIVHRDVKPANFLLDVKGNLWVTDFGLARCRSDASLTMTGDLLGTLRYMSPEQALAKRVSVDQRTDIYSLGVTLYELLTLEPAVAGRDREELLRKIAFDEPRPPRKINKAIPPDLETIVLKATTKDPDARYATAGEVAEELARFLDDRPIVARRPTIAQHVGKWCRRHKKAVTAAAVIFVLLVTTAGLGYKQIHDANWARYIEKVQGAVIDLCGERLHHEKAKGRGLDLKDKRGNRGPQMAPIGNRVSDATIRNLEDAIELFPSRPDAYYHLARAYLVQGQREKAAEIIVACLEQERDFAPARALSTSLLADKGQKWTNARPTSWSEAWEMGHHAMATGDWKLAVIAFSWLIEEGATKGEPYLGFSVEVRLGRGLARVELADWLALEDFGALAVLLPSSVIPGLLSGMVLVLKGERDAADQKFESLFAREESRNEVAVFATALYNWLSEHRKAVSWMQEIDPGFVREAFALVLYKKVGRYADAIAAGEAAVQLDPKNYAVRAQLGVAYFHADRPVEGRRQFDEAAELAHDRIGKAWVHFLKGYAVGSGRFEEFMEANWKAIDLDEKSHRFNLIYGLNKQGRYREALKQSDEELRHHQALHMAHLFRARIYVNVKESDEAVKSFTKALEISSKFPDALWGMARIERARKNFEKALKWYEEMRPDSWARHYNTGRILLYDLNKDPTAVIPHFEKALAASPKSRSAHLELAKIREGMGDAVGALELYAKVFEIDDSYVPAHRQVRAILRGEKSPALVSKLQDVFDRLEAITSEKDDRSLFLGTLALGRIAIPGRVNPKQALEYAGLGVEKTARKNADVLAVLAELQFASGSPRDAVRTVEEALELRDAPKALREVLAKYREEALPSLPSFAAIDSAFANREHEDPAATVTNGASLLREFRDVADGDDVLARVAYLEGRLLEKSGEPVRAAAKYEEVMNLKPDRPEPVLRLALALRSADAVAEAERELRETLKHMDQRELWNLWAEVSLVDLSRAPDEVLRDFPASGTSLAADYRWLLEQLHAGDRILINCGGEEYTGKSGANWGTDRFHVGGYQAFEGAQPKKGFDWEIKETEDDPLYQTHRRFPADEAGSGYRIPLPPGQYRVTLHFCEIIHGSAEERRFGVAVEGKDVLRDLDLFAEVGFAAAYVWKETVPIEDGALDLEFTPRTENPSISAIEIERLR